MHLDSIKLAGFKSFADPTQMLFEKSNLTAVIGPNGCGKSNVVDAIHFVLGSGSKNLRADLMADVIFNGTTTRKPVNQAFIELIFDNSDARIGGEYAQYHKISIRREVNRDGQSNYYINGTRCRRRDITDLFLGTGLGNNSYAIIEQGMISRLIEAKPEELRAHIEEAAGTSKYKERRRETENRIKQTRENLDRLNDIREEQGKQLTHLQRQANAAERFKVLKQEQRLLKAQLQGLLWQQLSQQIVGLDSQITAQENLLQAQVAELARLDAEMEGKRLLRSEQMDLVNQVQTQYYTKGSEINRIEQQITHSKERKRQLEQDAEQLQIAHEELKQQHFEDQNQIETILADSTKITADHQESMLLVEEYQVHLHDAEQQMQAWQEEWETFQQDLALNSKRVDVEKTKIHHLEQKQQSLLQRIAKIRDEERNQSSETVFNEVGIIKEQQDDLAQQLLELEETIAAIQDQIANQRNQHQEAQTAVETYTKALRDQQAKYASLEALQRIALGKSDDQMTGWLQQHDLNQHPRLAEGLEVAHGWELAVETALCTYLDAICVQEFTQLQQAISAVTNMDVVFFNTESSSRLKNGSHSLTKLSTKLTSSWPVANLLEHIYCADDFDTAVSLLPLLTENESIITKDGIWLSSTWLKINRHTHQKTGVLQREQEIKTVQGEIQALSKQLKEQELNYQETKDQLRAHMEKREELQHHLQEIQAKNSDFLAQIKAKESYALQLQTKEKALIEEMQENDRLLLEVEESLSTSKDYLATIEQNTVDEKQQRENRLLIKDKIRTELDTARQHVATYKQKANESKVRLESLRTQGNLLEQNVARALKQLATMAERRAAITKSLTEISDPLPELTVALQKALDSRLAVEQELQVKRQALAELENSLSQIEKHRHQVEKTVTGIRAELEEKRLSCQADKVRLEHHQEQVQVNGYEMPQIIDSLPQDANALVWEESITKLETRISRLGPINLAAIDEFAELSERKGELDKQYDDLVEALETLENAIRKIDKETRSRFKETYTQLNASFKEFFKEIFGNGDAYLELTSDDFLETGVLVKAQPPGKKNSTIHLLSGGEKALTAIALVFAIFSLNPAPFCILDEVDAPLDDANVGRYCNLVKKMSEKIQFIFISHNKIAIEMGQQLIGVTMHEPGVSRLVSVNVDQAISMATS